VKIKLYDKQKALDSISKLLGYNPAEKVDLNMKADVQVQMYLPENGRETADK
jgi:hypothetical protein